MNIKIGTRESKLALIQAESVKTSLEKIFPQIKFNIVKIKTTGDKILDSPLFRIGDKGLFTKEIEDALLKGDIDMAVHSMKDIPTILPPGLLISAVTKRLDPRDVLVSKKKSRLDQMAPGDTIATSSLRRKAQLKSLYPHLNFIDIRGNLQTRLRKMNESPDVDALVLARAGLTRLEMEELIAQIIPEDILLPAVGQAALAIESRDSDSRINNMLEKLNDPVTSTEIRCERAFLGELGGGCQVPVGALARIDKCGLKISGLVASLDGKVIYRDAIEGDVTKPEETGRHLAEKLLSMGASVILDEIYNNSRRGK